MPCPSHLHLSNFDAAIVDLDGTMVDTVQDLVIALHRMLDDLGLPSITAPLVRSMVGKGAEYLVGSVLLHVRKGQVPHDGLSDRAWTRFQHHYEETNGRHSEVYPGVVEGLGALRDRGLRLACLTNKPSAFAHALLEIKGLSGYFEVVFGGDAFERKKPDPLPLLMTCKTLGVAPARTLMVGDSSNDARAARAAGCPVVLVSYGYNHGEPVRDVDADGVVDSLADLQRCT